MAKKGFSLPAGPSSVKRGPPSTPAPISIKRQEPEPVGPAYKEARLITPKHFVVDAVNQCRHQYRTLFGPSPFSDGTNEFCVHCLTSKPKDPEPQKTAKTLD